MRNGSANVAEQTQKATAFREHLQHAEESANRAVQLAQDGIPDGGAALLVRQDPTTVGKKLFVQHCGTCHSFKDVCESGKFEASDLTDFASKEWIRSMLENPSDPRFFGRSKLVGMQKWADKHHDYRKSLELASKDEAASEMDRAEAREKLAYYDAWVDRVADWLATRPVGKPADEPKTPEEKRYAEGYKAFFDKDAKKIPQGRCYTCHAFDGKGGSEGPDLTGYGSADWIRLMIVAPGHPKRHGANNKMTAFRNDQGPGSEILLRELAETAGEKYSPLSDVDRELIIRFMVGDNRAVFFGRPISGPESKKKQ
jgi:mono/diheme cytochrome c family protein